MRAVLCTARPAQQPPATAATGPPLPWSCVLPLLPQAPVVGPSTASSFPAESWTSFATVHTSQARSPTPAADSTADSNTGSESADMPRLAEAQWARIREICRRYNNHLDAVHDIRREYSLEAPATRSGAAATYVKFIWETDVDTLLAYLKEGVEETAHQVGVLWQEDSDLSMPAHSDEIRGKRIRQADSEVQQRDCDIDYDESDISYATIDTTKTIDEICYAAEALLDRSGSKLWPIHEQMRKLRIARSKRMREERRYARAMQVDRITG